MDTKIERAISAYLDGSIELGQLQDELLQVTWDNPDAPKLALDAELAIAEAASEHRSAKRLQQDLAGLMQTRSALYA